jgi:PAS domain S-box-containing protein
MKEPLMRGLLVTAALLCSLKTFAATEPRPARNVLIIHEASFFYPAALGQDGTMIETVKAGGQEVEFFAEFLETARLPHFQEEGFGTYLKSKYERTRIDLIVPMGPQALDFALNHAPDLWPATPIVFYSVRPESIAGRHFKRNITGQTISFDVAGSVDLALRLHPKCRQLVIVAGTAPYDQKWVPMVEAQVRKHPGNLVTTCLTNLSLPELLVSVAKLPPDALIFYTSLSLDGASQPYVPGEVAPRLAAAASVPVYGCFETYMGAGAVGGSITSFREQGRRAGALALRVLAGEEPGAIPIQASPPSVPTVDWRQLEKWHIPRALLPSNCVVSFYTPRLWRRYLWPLIGVTGLLGAQSALIAGLLIQRRERRRSELELRQSEERYRDVVESQTDMVCRFLPDTTLTFVNSAFCRFFGRSREELVGSKFLDLMPESSRVGALNSISALLHRQEVLTHEHQVFLRSGRIAWHHWTNHIIHRSDGRTEEIQAVGRDVTDRKRAEEAQMNLAHASRLAAVGELTAVVAHEVNQPLGAILTNTEAAQTLLKSAEPPLGEIREILADIHKDDLRAGEAIRRIRALLQKNEIRLEQLDLNEALSDVLHLVAGDARRRGVHVRSKLAQDIPPVLGDRVHIQHVVLNLVVNAMDAMRDTPEPKRELNVETRKNGGSLIEVTVTDSGRGIPAPELPRLFDSFFTTKREGMGLGLSISRSIIEAHHGRIWAENNQPGATFHFTVPIEKETHPATS